jgi:hypothetical protein
MQDFKDLLRGDKIPQDPKFKTQDAKLLADQSKNSGEKLDSFNRLKQDEEAKANEKISNRKKGLSYFLLATVLLLGACAFMGAIPAGAVLVAFLCAPMAKLLGDVAISKISDSGKKIARLKNRAYQNGTDLNTTSTDNLKNAQNEKTIKEAQVELQKAQAELQKAQIEKQKAELQKEIDKLGLSNEDYKINEINDKLFDEFKIGSNLKDKKDIIDLNFNNKITDKETKDFIAEQVETMRKTDSTQEDKTKARKILNEVINKFDEHKKLEDKGKEAHDAALAAVAPASVATAAGGGAGGGAPATGAAATYNKKEFKLDAEERDKIKKEVDKKIEIKKQSQKGDGQTV